MSALVWVELRRCWSRRAVRLVGVLALILIVVASTIVFVNSKRPADLVRAARAEREAAIVSCIEMHRSGPAREVIPAEFESAEEFCRSPMVAPPLESFDPRFHLTTLSDMLRGTSIPLIILGLALGASFIGAEWGAGTVTTLLTWEPRRVRLLAAKALAAASFVLIAAVGVQVLVGLALVPAAVFRGTTQGADLEWLRSTAGVVLRGSVVAAVAAAIGFSIASLARNTAAALVVGFAYFAVLEGLIRGFRPRWARWLIGDNAALFIIGPEEMNELAHSRGRALATLLAYAAALIALAAAVFRARDVT